MLISGMSFAAASDHEKLGVYEVALILLDLVNELLTEMSGPPARYRLQRNVGPLSKPLEDDDEHEDEIGIPASV